MKGTYFRWTRLERTTAENRAGDNVLAADILGSDVDIVADPNTGLVQATIPDRPMDPDTARMIGVRLIDAAALADNGRSVREP